ncbi:MAG: hypothetical protein WC975_06880 [Phycisphaerae bacterium]
MRPTENIKCLIKNAKIKTNPKVNEAVLKDLLNELDVSQKKRSAVSPPNVWRNIMKSKIIKFAVAAVVMIAVLIGIHHFNGTIDGSSVAWADVIEQFKTVKFFTAVVYRKDNVDSKPEQIELWAGENGHERIFYGNQVAFGKDGYLLKTFDVKTKRETEPSSQLKGLFSIFLREARPFSLETIIKSFSNGQLIDTTSVVSTEMISSELAVFDIEAGNTSEWCRVWVLRGSKLPVYMRVWNPRDGGCIDVVFTYAKPPNETFFDPNAFAVSLKSREDSSYLYPNDPTGKPVSRSTPDKSQIFKVWTQTIDGKPWSFAEMRGKTIVICFWDGPASWSGGDTERVLESVSQKYGKMADFAMVGVVLSDNMENARAFFTSKTWNTVLLYEPGKRYRNSVVQALGSTDARGIYLVSKDGTVKRLHGHDMVAIAQVDDEFVGLTYDSQYTGLLSKICKGMSEKQVRQLLGPPDSVDHNNGMTSWHYQRFRQDKAYVFSVLIQFDPSGKCKGWGTADVIVDPATIKIMISSQYWQEHVISQVDQKVLAKAKGKIFYEVSAVHGNTSHPIGASARGIQPGSFKPGKGYTRQMVPGRYDLVVEVRDVTEHNINRLQQIILEKDVTLGTNEEKTFKFE